MNMWKLGWLCLALSLCACPPAPMGECGGYTCTAGQRCESSTQLCVTDELPIITVVTPTAPVNTPTFVLTGTITDDISVKAAFWRAGDTGDWTPIERDGDAKFTITVNAPLLDAQNLIVNFRASDANSEASKAVPVLVDRVGPALRLIRPVGTLIGTATVEIAVDATDGSGSLFDLSIAGVAVVSPASGIEVVRTIPVPATLNGEPLRFEVASADLRGNRTTQTFSVIADRVAPVLSFISPLADQYVITPTFQVELQVVDPSPIASVSFQLAGGTYAATQTAGIWIAEIPFALEEADQLITAEATDAAGNVATAQVSVHVDRIVPTVTVNTPIAASLHRTGIPVSVTTSLGTDSVTASLEGQQVTLTGGPTSWSGTLPIPQRDYSAAMVQVTARDLAGNSRVVDVAVMVDAVAPVVVFTSPASNQKFNATHFATTSSVTSSWTVTDADPQAATSTVNGVASSALTIAVPTTTNDNPAAYTTTVTASDRAGNTTTTSVSYSVDRVAPSIVAFTPAANSRMVATNGFADITFSEPVFGALTASPALTSSVGNPSSQWLAGHARFQLTLSFPGQVVDVSLVPGLADDHGNPVPAVPPRRFHIATTIAEGTVIASGVSVFRASSDADGALTVAYLDTANRLWVVQDQAGTLVSYPFMKTGTAIAVNSSNTVNPTTLVSSPSFAVSMFDGAGAGTNKHWYYARGYDGTWVTSAVPVGPGAVFSQGPLNREPSTPGIAYILGNTYSRGAFSNVLPTPANLLVAQSADSWANVSFSGSVFRWSRFRCNRDAQIFPGPATYTCGGTEYGGTVASLVPDMVEAVMTRSGNCLVINIAGQGAGGPGGSSFYQPLQNCDGALGVSPPPSCDPNTNVPRVAAYFRQRVATFSGNGEDTILHAFPAGTGNPNEFRLEKMLPGVCAYSTTFNTLISVPNVRDFAPIQIGNRAAFLYVTTSNELRVHYP